jgi:hypothetical protein
MRQEKCGNENQNDFFCEKRKRKRKRRKEEVKRKF